MSKIKDLKAHRILNSRGTWTVDISLELENGLVVEQTVPDGASKGENEAVTIPVEKSIEFVQTVIRDALIGENVTEQEKIDHTLIDMDGTPNKSRLGGNTTLAVSLACVRASAEDSEIELYKYLRWKYYDDKSRMDDKLKFPTPLFNVLNGGKHATNNLSFQEFMLIPSPEFSFQKQMDIGVSVYNALKENLKKDGFGTGVGDEGGFAPTGFTVSKALSYLSQAVSGKYELGKDVFLGMDVAAESFVNHEEYIIEEEKKILSVSDFIEYYRVLIDKYPLIYIEDPFYEKDFDGWKMFHDNFSDKLMVVADDLVVTNANILKKVVDKNICNAVIVKPNQVGTLTETFDFVKKAREAKMTVIVSHRSGDTAEDTFIADLALAVDAEFIKSGAPVRGERVVKYNRLLDIIATL